MNEPNYAYELSRLTARIDELERLVAKLKIKTESSVCYDETVKIAMPETGKTYFPGDPVIYKMVPTVIKREEELKIYES